MIITFCDQSQKSHMTHMELWPLGVGSFTPQLSSQNNFFNWSSSK